MRILTTIAIIFTIILLSISALNLYIIFDEGHCICSACLGKCVLRSEEVPAECAETQYEKINCTTYSCKEIQGKCIKIPKILEINTYMRGN